MMHMVSLILPKAHRDTLEVLFVFLKWVASFAHLDEETGSNLTQEDALAMIAPLLERVKREYATAEKWLRNWYDENVIPAEA